MNDIEYKTDFKPGDVVRLEDGDGRHHIIKEINWEPSTKSWFATVIFEDNSAKGFIWDDGKYSDMVLIE